MKGDVMLNVKVKTKWDVAEDICAFELVDVQGNSLPPFMAGSHVDVHIPGNFIRQYSLCNSPSETGRYVIGVLKDPASRGGSKAMHDLEEGSLLSISEPRNHFPLADGSDHSILFAGGIGITGSERATVRTALLRTLAIKARLSRQIDRCTPPDERHFSSGFGT
jgi:vanillate O-demethylase ferredoxin subunit